MKSQNYTSIYLKDPIAFKQGIAELRVLWMKHFGENLADSELIVKALAFTKNFLLDELKESKVAVTKKYGRLPC